MSTESPYEDLRRIKQALKEAVREADAAISASLPSPEELAVIKSSFGDSVDRAAKMMEALQREFAAKPRPVRPPGRRS